MKRIDRAYEQNKKEYESKDIIIIEYCPYFLDVGEDDADAGTTVEDSNGNVLGCRGITCVKCWDREED